MPSFNVTLYKFTKEVNSTKRPPAGTGDTFKCVTNNTLDLINPVFPFNIGSGNNPTAYNYVWCHQLARYFWIIRWAWENGLWVAYCSVDPLASWKTDIGNTYAYVLRAAAASDGSIMDHMYPTKAGPTITKTAITSPYTTLSFTSGHFRVGVINRDGATQYYKMSPSTFKSFTTAAFSDSFFSNNIIDGQTWMTKAIFDPMQYLSSVIWFPNIPGGGLASTVYLGYWSTGVQAVQLEDNQIGYYNHTSSITVTLPKHPQAASRGSFLNSGPYTSHILDLKPFGRIAVDAAAVSGETSIKLDIVTDYITGVAVLRVLRSSDNTPLITQQAQVGIPVQVSQVLRDYFGGAMSVVGGVTRALTSGSLSGLITGGLSAIGGAVEAAMPDVTTSGVNGGFAGLYGDWSLISTFYSVAAEDNTHRGRPLCQVRKLSTLSGYQLLTDTDLEIPCTRMEMDAIKGYLESGYYFE